MTSKLRKCNKGFGECYHCDPEPDAPRNAQTELTRLTALLEDRTALRNEIRKANYDFEVNPPRATVRSEYLADRLIAYLKPLG